MKSLDSKVAQTSNKNAMKDGRFVGGRRIPKNSRMDTSGFEANDNIGGFAGHVDNVKLKVGKTGVEFGHDSFHAFASFERSVVKGVGAKNLTGGRNDFMERGGIPSIHKFIDKDTDDKFHRDDCGSFIILRVLPASAVFGGSDGAGNAFSAKTKFAAGKRDLEGHARRPDHGGIHLTLELRKDKFFESRKSGEIFAGGFERNIPFDARDFGEK